MMGAEEPDQASCADYRSRSISPGSAAFSAAAYLAALCTV
jgi:hypothetical protein